MNPYKLSSNADACGPQGASAACRFRKTLRAGKLEGLRRFFDEGVSIYQEDGDTPSPMAHALETANVELVRLLLERGYDVNRSPLAKLTKLCTSSYKALHKPPPHGYLNRGLG
jgi:hypothetical protein